MARPQTTQTWRRNLPSGRSGDTDAGGSKWRMTCARRWRAFRWRLASQAVESASLMRPVRLPLVHGGRVMTTGRRRRRSGPRMDQHCSIRTRSGLKTHHSLAIRLLMMVAVRTD